MNDYSAIISTGIFTSIVAIIMCLINEKGCKMDQYKRDNIEYRYNKDKYTCQACGESVINKQGQQAHVIINSKANRKKYGTKILEHWMNKRTVCSLRCNDAMNIGQNKVLQERLAKEIEEELIKEINKW